MSTIASLQREFSKCSCSACKVPQCEICLVGFPSARVILDIDCVMSSGKRGRRCDFVIVADEGGATFFMPVEFKSTNVDMKKVKTQLEGGIKFFKEYLPKQFACLPLLVSKSLKAKQRNILLKLSITYNGKKARIKHVRCNQSLRWRDVKHNER